MPRTLPQTPSLRFLQKEAKDILKAHKSGDTLCCSTLRYHFRFSRAADEEIVNAEVSLQEAQHALALDYGFKCWKDLKGNVEAHTGAETPPTQADEIITQMLRIAVRDHAGDLHIEPMSTGVNVRYRVDGVLYEMQPLSSESGHAVVDAIMQMCKMDTAAKEYPQDSRMLVDVEGKRIDIRVNITPGIHGGVVAMRILDRSQVNLSLDRLDMEADQLELYKQQIHRPNGVILLAGPSGCGKTTSLYATLMELNDTRRKIVTVEDPVEFELDGIDQIPLRPSIGLGFEPVLRSVLRQAPNVIMAGEIRNLETAQLLVQAAFTGHLVFSTLHTDECIGTLARLLNIGMEAHLLADSIICVVAQRLVRRICENCKTAYTPGADEFASLQLAGADREKPLYHGAGCEKCNDLGYRGRSGIYSIMPITGQIIERLLARDMPGIELAAREGGWTTLREAAIRKMLKGETTPEEVIKFT